MAQRMERRLLFQWSNMLIYGRMLYSHIKIWFSVMLAVFAFVNRRFNSVTISDLEIPDWKSYFIVLVQIVIQ